MASVGRAAAAGHNQPWPLVFTLLVIAAVLLTTVGCQPKVVLGKVHGQVSFQKEPLAAGIVGFSNETSGIHMTATLDKDGRYMVSMAKGFGLPPGDYQVAVYPFIADLPIGSTTAPEQHEFPNIPARYRQPATSGLTLTVREGDNPYDIDMQP